MNREDVIVRIAAHEAAAAALREALTTEARNELIENHTAPSWRLRDGSLVAVSMTQPHLRVLDEDAFIAHSRDKYPDEFVEVTEIRWRNPAFRKRILAELTAMPLVVEAAHERGELEFLEFVKGGEYRTTSITIAPETKERMAASARTYALAGETMPELEGPRP